MRTLMDWLPTSLLFLLLISRPCGAPKPPPTLDPSSVLTIFRNGDSGYPFFRIPSLLHIPSSSLLLAFAEARGQRTDHGNVAIVVKSSTDHGVSWSDLRVVHKQPGATIGNPTPLYDSSEVVLFFCRENKEIFQTRSTDDGQTWTTPRALEGWKRPAEWKWVAAGPPAALVTSSGRWVLPCDGLTGSPQIYKAASAFSFVLLSDDRGASWRLQSGPLLDGGNECQAAELPNGAIVLNMRSRDGVRLHAISHDGGETWSEPRRAKPAAVSDANCQGSLIAWRHGLSQQHEGSEEGSGQAANGEEPTSQPLVLATSVGPGRRQLTARTSRDGVDGWSVLTILEAGPAGYSATVELEGGWAGCLYETRRPKLSQNMDGGAKQRPHNPMMDDDVIVFARFNVTAQPICESE